MIELVVGHSLATGNRPLLQVTRAFQAELALRQADIAEASLWARAFDPEPFRATHRFYVPQLTFARILLAQESRASQQRAAKVLVGLHDFFTSIHNTRFRFDVLAMQALLHDAQGDQAAALAKLKVAARLAKPGGFIRPFVDLGPRMAVLFDQLHSRGVAPDYVAQILAAFRKETKDEGSRTKGSASSFVAHKGPSSPVHRPSSALIEPLTPRELEVLALLAQQLSNKELAARLVITPGTVKQHTHNIYQKLNVRTRWQAVTEAEALGILPSNTE